MGNETIHFSSNELIILDKHGRPVSLEDVQILMEDELDAELQCLQIQSQHNGEYDPIAFMTKALALLEELTEQIVSRLQERQN